MKLRNTIIAFLLLITVNVQAEKLTIQERLLRLERQTPTQSSNATAEMHQQLLQLQQQIAQLQGQIEEQNHQIEALKKRQKVLYVDMDARLAKLESATVGDNSTAQKQVQNTSQPSFTANTPEVRQPIDAQVNTQGLNQAAVNATTEPANVQVKTEYQLAFNQLKAGRFTESAQLFEGFIQKYPNNDLTDNAYYWLGESYYVSRNYPPALAAFQNLHQKFPLSDKLPDALLKIGYTYHELEDYVQAEQALQKVVNSFPGQPVARLAEKRLNLLRRDGKIN